MIALEMRVMVYLCIRKPMIGLCSGRSVKPIETKHMTLTILSIFVTKFFPVFYDSYLSFCHLYAKTLKDPHECFVCSILCNFSLHSADFLSLRMPKEKCSWRPAAAAA